MLTAISMRLTSSGFWARALSFSGYIRIKQEKISPSLTASSTEFGRLSRFLQIYVSEFIVYMKVC